MVKHFNYLEHLPYFEVERTQQKSINPIIIQRWAKAVGRVRQPFFSNIHLLASMNN